jgi:threonylcarbamoyladenosine tRNA methylthiotransferase MtaB
MEKTFSTVTIGCKLNQFETEWIREALVRRNWRYRRFEDGAAVCIINSCTVTARSDARCRNAARRAKRIDPGSFVVVTGCCAELQRERLGNMGEIDLVLGNGEKRALPAIVDEIGGREREDVAAICRRISRSETPDLPGIERFLDRARAFVKVQEGCDASCSYCIVPRARGPSRSVSVPAILEQIRALRENGYREIVLTGVHVGRYGADFDPPATLAGLVGTILDRIEGIRIRLGSIEASEVTPRLLEIARATERLAPHFHIPMQSGDDSILAAMNRSYRASAFREIIGAIAAARSGMAIGTDIIVGFPGETDRCFEHTFELARELPISFFHVFAFSPRPMTPAASMDGAVSPAAKRERSKRLIELGNAKKRAFVESHVGSRHLALVQGARDARSPRVRSLTGTYCEVLVPREAGPTGSLVPVRVERLDRGILVGTPVVGFPAPERVQGARER